MHEHEADCGGKERERIYTTLDIVQEVFVIDYINIEQRYILRVVKKGLKVRKKFDLQNRGAMLRDSTQGMAMARPRQLDTG